jgi:glycosyltransferase involved in cell wall biosynthesis
VRTFALAAYPLSAGFRDELERQSRSPLEIVVLPELRRLRARALVRRLRSLEGDCLLPIEDPASEVLLPILECLAAATRARTVEIVRVDGSREKSSRLRSALHAAKLLGASADAQVALRLARRDVNGLLRVPRSPAALHDGAVLFLNANLWFGVRAGGSIAHVAGVANAFVERGIALELATAPEPVGVTAAATIHRLRPPRTFGLPPEANLYRFGRSVVQQLHDVPPPAFVYQRHSLGSYAGAILARRAGVPLVLEYNGSEVWVARNWGRPLHYERLALDAEEASLRHASLVVTVSQVLADELARRGVDPDRIVWHSNGVDARRFDPARFSDAERLGLRDRYGIPHDAVLVTFVGTFGQWHGVDVLARTIRREAAWARAAGVRFLLVGDGLTMPAVRTVLDGLSDIAVLAGLVAQDETPLYLAASDVLVSPHVPNADGSAFFGSPTKLFEYMAAGKAIVASDLDQVGDVLRDGLAVLVRPGDETDLGRGLREAVGSPGLRTELGARARARALARHTWDDHVGAVIENLRRVSGAPVT